MTTINRLENGDVELRIMIVVVLLILKAAPPFPVCWAVSSRGRTAISDDLESSRQAESVDC